MHRLRADILSLFRSSGAVLSTTEIVERLFSEQISDQAVKAKLHRRVLHHIHRLMDERVLSVEQVGAKGQKFFSLTHPVQGRRTAVQEWTPALPIERYMDKDILFKYEPDTWITRMNAILLEASKYDDLRRFRDELLILFDVVNDVVLVNDFEYLVERYSVEELLEVFIALERECRDYNKRICLIIDLTNVEHDEGMVRFFQAFLPLDSKGFTVIFDVTPKELMQHTALFEKLVGLFSRYRLKFNIKNDDLHAAPFGVGRAGPYTFDQEEWRSYVEHLFPGPGRCVGMVQSSVIVDVKQFFDEFTQASLFSEMMQQIAKSLFMVNSLQRRHTTEYFQSLYDNDLHHNLLSLSKMAVRFWNYEFEHPYIDRDGVLELISSMKEKMKEFCSMERTIYLSCGMPRRFSMGFSCAYRRVSTGSLLVESFQKTYLRSMNEIYSKKLHDTMLFREQLGDLFSLGDEVRFQRKGVTDPQNVVREFQALLHTFRFPFFCYNFSEPSEATVTLNHFLDGGSI
ncbi:MAG: hypothetical protein ACOCWQ_01895 [Nanoarchaeota archaeon]